MAKKAAEISPEQAVFNALHEEYKAYIEGLRWPWMRENNHQPKYHTLYELDPQEQKRVDYVIKKWGEYITPLAEAWWKERGYELQWPEDARDPCKLSKLAA